MLRGIGTSKGIGIGHVLVVLDYEIEINEVAVSDVEAEINVFFNARQKFIDETEELIRSLAKRLSDDNENALVLKNQIYLINDITLENEIINCIKTKKICAEAAVNEACNNYITIFEAMDNEEMKQRVSDIADMKNRIIRIIRGADRIDLTTLPENTVIVAQEIHPSMTAHMDTANVVGIVAGKGGETSHASILARALEIPAVLSVKGITEAVENGDEIIVDGAYGEVFVKPAPTTKRIYIKKKETYDRQMLELKAYINKNTETKDGRKVMLAANIGGYKECARVNSDKADGVGLFRTEFLFMNGVSMPDEEQQFEEYKRAAVLLKGKPLTIRTLDIGGDKDIPYMGLSKENNPFLGYRAIRFCLDRIDVFTTQLRAILRASAYGNIRIMLPMVTSVNEIIQVKRLINDIGRALDKSDIKYDKDIKLGVMIETPSAAIMADVIAKEADFFSIGTNDLTQYTIAVDRCNENVSYLYSPFNPAVLRLIKHVVECAHNEHIEVAMCGEAAGKEMMIPLLLSFGLDEFSVSTSKILETRKNIAGWTIQEADIITRKVMAMSTEKEIADYLNEYMAGRETDNV